MEISGSCLCKAVQFKISDTPKAVINCHCDFCRKHSGGAFSTYLIVAETVLELTSGQDSIVSFQLRENAYKHFCRQCGTPIYNKNAKYSGLSMVYLGAVSASSEIAPTANIYCESQLPWVPAIAEIRTFQQGIVKQAK